MNDEQLILLVQANDCLFNKYNPSYKQAEKKKNIWHQIAKEMQCTDEMCIKRWSNLRERYAREKRIENFPSGSGSNCKPQWPLLPLMEFIAPHIVPRPTRCSYNVVDDYILVLPGETSSSPSESPPPVPARSGVVLQNASLPPTQNSLMPFPQNASSNDVYTKPPSKPLPPTPSVPKRRRNNPEVTDVDDFFSDAVGAFKKLCKSKEEKEKEEEKDPLHGFGMMIVATIATMNPVKQVKAMQRLTALVMEIKLEPDY